MGEGPIEREGGVGNWFYAHSYAPLEDGAALLAQLLVVALQGHCHAAADVAEAEGHAGSAGGERVLEPGHRRGRVLVAAVPAGPRGGELGLGLLVLGEGGRVVPLELELLGELERDGGDLEGAEGLGQLEGGVPLEEVLAHLERGHGLAGREEEVLGERIVPEEERHVARGRLAVLDAGHEVERRDHAGVSEAAVGPLREGDVEELHGLAAQGEPAGAVVELLRDTPRGLEAEEGDVLREGGAEAVLRHPAGAVEGLVRRKDGRLETPRAGRVGGEGAVEQEDGRAAGGERRGGRVDDHVAVLLDGEEAELGHGRPRHGHGGVEVGGRLRPAARDKDAAVELVPEDAVDAVGRVGDEEQLAVDGVEEEDPAPVVDDNDAGAEGVGEDAAEAGPGLEAELARAERRPVAEAEHLDGPARGAQEEEVAADGVAGDARGVVALRKALEGRRGPTAAAAAVAAASLDRVDEDAPAHERSRVLLPEREGVHGAEVVALDSRGRGWRPAAGRRGRDGGRDAVVVDAAVDGNADVGAAETDHHGLDEQVEDRGDGAAAASAVPVTVHRAGGLVDDGHLLEGGEVGDARALGVEDDGDAREEGVDLPVPRCGREDLPVGGPGEGVDGPVGGVDLRELALHLLPRGHVDHLDEAPARGRGTHGGGAAGDVVEGVPVELGAEDLLAELLGVGRDDDNVPLGEAKDHIAVPDPPVGDNAAVLGLEGELDRLIGLGGVVEEDGLAPHVDGHGGGGGQLAAAAAGPTPAPAPGLPAAGPAGATGPLRRELDALGRELEVRLLDGVAVLLREGEHVVRAAEREAVVLAPVPAQDGLAVLPGDGELLAAVLAEDDQAALGRPDGQLRPDPRPLEEGGVLEGRVHVHHGAGGELPHRHAVHAGLEDGDALRGEANGVCVSEGERGGRLEGRTKVARTSPSLSQSIVRHGALLSSWISVTWVPWRSKMCTTPAGWVGEGGKRGGIEMSGPRREAYREPAVCRTVGARGAHEGRRRVPLEDDLAAAMETVGDDEEGLQACAHGEEKRMTR
jgi:hypothetical protein